jgi:bacillithiol biosynthesis cysteine-adding enzyme BshC
MAQQQTQLTPNRTINLTGESLSFRDVPETTRLFLDFVYEFDRVRSFYAPVEPHLDALIRFAPTITSQTYSRDLLVQVLLEQNREFGSSPETFHRIEQLRATDTVAVVTGQQAGLFTGPLYTILKALTAVKVSRDLCARGISAVPVFWIECDDHDQAEVSQTFVTDRDGRLTQVSYPIDPSLTGKPIKDLVLTEAIHETIDQLLSLLPTSEFVPELEQQIRDAYAPGTNMAVAFGRLLAQWFRDFDLVLLDPTDVRLKSELTGLFSQTIQHTREIVDPLINHTQRLTDAGYHAQLRIHDEMVPLFIEHEGNRSALVYDAGRFALKNDDVSFTQEELLKIAQTQPGRISPSVVLRPFVQDTLLPTLVYIGGPSEIAYLAQLTPLAELFGRPATPIMMRASATLIEPRYSKWLHTYSLNPQDLFQGFDHVMTSIVENSLAGDAAARFDATHATFEERLNHLRDLVASVDSTLIRAADTTKEKILGQLNQLRSKFNDAQARKDETTLRQVQRAFSTLYPDGGLQERQLNILHFLSRYGLGLMPPLMETLDVWPCDHHIIKID